MDPSVGDRGKRAAPSRRSVLRAVLSGAAAASALVVAGCGSTPQGGAAEPEPAARLSVSVPKDSTDASPIVPVVLSVADGTLSDASMRGPDGQVVSGDFDQRAGTWTSTQPLAYGTTYKLVSSAADDKGLVTTDTTSFTTLTPKVMTAAYTVTGEGSTFGIGQPVAIHFDETIPDRRAAQEAIEVTTDPPVEGAFYWVNGQEVRWRPQEYWKPGTKVDVTIDVFGKDLGQGTYGQENAHTGFAIGEAVISRVDDSTKQITVERNGEVVRTMPTSLGKPSDPTPNGVYIIGDRHSSLVMDSSTYGVAIDAPDGYRTNVQYATQMSYSGIFVHAAPWSVWAQGSSNTSHGCLNVSTSNAEWFYENSTRGDIVIVSGTAGDTLSGEDGLGDWNVPWETWKAGNVDT